MLVEVAVDLSAKDEFDVLNELSELVEFSPIDVLVGKFAARRAFEGVGYSENEVPKALMGRLNDQIDGLKAGEPADYHPGSNGVVRDLVHPSLFPLIKGTSKIVGDIEPEVTKGATKG